MNKKNIVNILLIVFLGLFLVGCSSSESTENTEIDTQVEGVEENFENVEVIENPVEKTESTVNSTLEIIENLSENVTESLDESILKIEEVVENENVNTITESFPELKKAANDSNVSVSVNSENQVVIESNSNRVVDETLSIEEWCLAGESFNFETTEGDVSSTIIGPEMFKEKEYCMASGETTVSGISIESTYYFNNGATDVWVVFDLFGQTTEQNIVLN
jgi:PBP1b-binding outer membrane lipoprotein LpoB